MKESAVLLLVPSHHVPEKENTKRKVSEKYNSFNIVIMILLIVAVLEIVRICQSPETIDLGSGQAGDLTAFSMAAQSNAEVVPYFFPQCVLM